MQCPYNRKSAKWVKKYKNDLASEETGVVLGCEEVLIEEYTLMNCPKEECGAWYKGRCNYNQGVNE